MKNWASVDPSSVPFIQTELPGPKSREVHERCSTYMKGYSSQVKLFPVAFDSGFGYTLTDVDGNKYIDFSSGIYVTGLGHCHPKISEAVATYAKKLMNCHDFSTTVKMELMEKLHEITGGRFGGFQLYDSGTTAVEAGLRCARAATGKFEFYSFWRDFHGKTLGAVSCAVVGADSHMRAPGFYLAPRPNPYRDAFGRSKEEAMKDSTPYIRMLEGMIDNESTGNVAAIVFEPIYRIVTGTAPEKLISYIDSRLGCAEKCQCVTVVTAEKQWEMKIPALHSLTVGSLQMLIDDFLREEKGSECDYIHGVDSLEKIVKDKECIGFIFDGVEKEDLFDYVAKNGTLPRKTFSMGTAAEKRYYIEARAII